MTSALNIALSGMKDATLRIKTSADNIANANSTTTPSGDGPYIPKDVVSLSQDTGGVLSKVEPSNKDPILIADADHPDANSEGIVAYPAVDTAEELVNQIGAEAAYKANLKVIETEKRMSDSLMDAFA